LYQMEKVMTKRILLELTNKSAYYKKFKKDISFKLSVKDYAKYLRIIADTFKTYIVEGGLIILPYSLGKIYVSKKQRVLKTPSGNIKKRYVNWKATYDLRKEKYPHYTVDDWKKPENRQVCLIVYDLTNTGGYTYKITWIKFGYKGNTNANYYYFKPIVRFSRQLGKYISNENIKTPSYYESIKVY
jgi:hypothetical protein